MKNILISGAPSVGKSSVIEQLEKKVPQSQRIVTYDQARWYMQAQNLRADTMTRQQKEEMQRFVIATYIGALKHCTHSHIMGILDGSLIEAINYSTGVVPDNLTLACERYLSKYKDHSIAYIIPPTIPLVDDGLRHTDATFREEMHEKIVQTIVKHKIPYYYVLSDGPKKRADEILEAHMNLSRV